MAIVLKLPVGRRFKFLLESNKLDDDDKEMYRELISLNKSQIPVICQMRSIWKFMTGCTNGIKSLRNQFTELPESHILDMLEDIDK